MWLLKGPFEGGSVRVLGEQGLSNMLFRLGGRADLNKGAAYPSVGLLTLLSYEENRLSRRLFLQRPPSPMGPLERPARPEDSEPHG